MFSDVRAAFGAIRKALTERGGDSPLSRYTVRDGSVFAQSTGMTAVSPCDFFPDCEFAVAAKEVDDALDRLVGDVAATVDRDVLTLRAGRSRVTIRVGPPDHHGVSAEGIKLRRPPRELVDVIRLLVPFGDAKAQMPWMASLIMRPTYTAVCGDGKIIAASPVSIGDGLMPLSAAEFMAARGQPRGWGVVGDAIYATWEDGSWARLSLIAGAVPTILDGLIEGARTAETPDVVDDAWRESIARVASLSDGTLELEGDTIRGTRGPMEVGETVAAAAGSDPIRFAAKYLTAAANGATSFSFGSAPKVWWRGEKLFGVVTTQLG